MDRKEKKSDSNVQPKDSQHPKSGGNKVEVSLHFDYSRYLTHLFSSGSGITIQGNHLHIPSLTKENSGDWECIASNGIQPDASKKITVSVRGISSFKA